MDPQKLRKLVRRRAIPVVLITLSGGLVADAVTSRITPVYQAQATVRVVSPQSPFGGVVIENDQVTHTAATLMTEPPILQRVINELKLNTTTDQLSRRVTAIPITNTQLVNVTVLDPDASLATRIANALSSDFVDQVTQVGQQTDQRIKAAGAAYQDRITSLNNQLHQLAEAPQGQSTSGLRAAIAAMRANDGPFWAIQAQSPEKASIATLAQQPAQPASPSLALNLALGLLAGLLVALGLAALAEYRDRRAHSEGVGFRHDRSW